LPPRDWRLRVEDILDAIARIEQYVNGLTLEQFRADSKTVDAVVRNLEVIGEAVLTCPPTIVVFPPRLHGPISPARMGKRPYLINRARRERRKRGKRVFAPVSGMVVHAGCPPFGHRDTAPMT
jgi:hypothetical protein